MAKRRRKRRTRLGDGGGGSHAGRAVAEAFKAQSRARAGDCSTALAHFEQASRSAGAAGRSVDTAMALNTARSALRRECLK